MTKKTKLAVIIVCAAFLVSMLGSYMIQTSFFTVKQKVTVCSMDELLVTIADNEAKYNKDLGPTLSKSSLSQISLTTYIPKNATPENPAPVIVCAHGWNNSKEQQILNFVEPCGGLRFPFGGVTYVCFCHIFSTSHTKS